MSSLTGGLIQIPRPHEENHEKLLSDNFTKSVDVICNVKSTNGKLFGEAPHPGRGWLVT